MDKKSIKAFSKANLIINAKINAQECPALISPLDCDTVVPVDSLTKWTAVNGVIEYLVSLGTTPGR